MNELVKNLAKTLADEENRYIYADTITNAFISAQIKALREDRELSQENLAQLIGTKQSGISRLERVDYSAWTIETLRKIARAFGVRLRIRFEEFGTLVEERPVPGEIGGFAKKSLLPCKFEDDPIFGSQREQIGAAPLRIGAHTAAAVDPNTGDLPSLSSPPGAQGRGLVSDGNNTPLPLGPSYQSNVQSNVLHEDAA